MPGRLGPWPSRPTSTRSPGAWLSATPLPQDAAISGAAKVAIMPWLHREQALDAADARHSPSKRWSVDVTPAMACRLADYVDAMSCYLDSERPDSTVLDPETTADLTELFGDIDLIDLTNAVLNATRPENRPAVTQAMDDMFDDVPAQRCHEMCDPAGAVTSFQPASTSPGNGGAGHSGPRRRGSAGPPWRTGC